MVVGTFADPPEVAKPTAASAATAAGIPQGPSIDMKAVNTPGILIAFRAASPVAVTLVNVVWAAAVAAISWSCKPIFKAAFLIAIAAS